MFVFLLLCLLLINTLEFREFDFTSIYVMLSKVYNNVLICTNVLRIVVALYALDSDDTLIFEIITNLACT